MSSIEIDGQCYFAHAAAHTKAKLSFLEQGKLSLSFEGEVETIWVNIDDVKISSKLGNTPREITFPDGELFSYQDTPLSENWLMTHGTDSKLDKLERNKSFVVLGLFLIPLITYGLFKFAIPSFAIHFASWVPESIIEMSSQRTLTALDKLLLEPSELDKKKQENLIKQWHKDVEVLLGVDHRYHFLFRDSVKLGANAFALPDGTIVVTDDLVHMMNEHQDALFSIILHEIGHVEQEHSMRFIAETMATSVLVNFMFGDVSGIVDFFVGASATMLNNQFSQKHEWEADNFAIDTLKQNNLNPESFATAMELFLKEHNETGLDKLLSSHPLLKERAENARMGAD